MINSDLIILVGAVLAIGLWTATVAYAYRHLHPRPRRAASALTGYIEPEQDVSPRRAAGDTWPRQAVSTGDASGRRMGSESYPWWPHPLDLLARLRAHTSRSGGRSSDSKVDWS